MSDILALVARFGFPTVATAVVLYMLLRGELHFRYPRRKPGYSRMTESGDEERFHK